MAAGSDAVNAEAIVTAKYFGSALTSEVIRL
jgi:hypothetical protein